jgi:hypothetical protein
MAESRVEIGFDGGLIISAKVPDEEWSKLQAGLAAVEFAAEGTSHHVDVSKVCYVRREMHVGKVGF